MLCTSSHALAVVQIMWEKLKEHYITSLGPVFFSNDGNIGSADNRNSCINLVIDNTNIIMNHYKNFNILLFKEAMKINETKPILNTGLKASNAIVLRCFKINFV